MVEFFSRPAEVDVDWHGAQGAACPRRGLSPPVRCNENKVLHEPPFAPFGGHGHDHEGGPLWRNATFLYDPILNN